MTIPRWGEVRWGNFVWNGMEAVDGSFEIVGEEVILKFKVADIGKLIQGGTFELIPEEEEI